VRYALGLPPVPWCVKKCLIREAFRGILPSRVSDRPKTTLLGDPAANSLSTSSSEPTWKFCPAPELDAFVVRDQLPPLTEGGPLPWGLWAAMRPIVLGLWLARRETGKIRNED
jgi:hypothetical protein